MAVAIRLMLSVALIKKDGVRHYLGVFQSAELANEAYKTASHKLHGKFSIFNKQNG